MEFHEKRRVAEWVEEARDGGAEAMDALARFYTKRLGQLFRRVQDRHLVEDLIQETLVVGLCGLKSLRDPLCFDAFIFRIGRRLYMNTFRRKRLSIYDPRRISTLEELGRVRPLRAKCGLSIEAESALRVALDSLPEEELALVQEHHCAGVPLAPLALRAGLTVPTLKMRLYRVRRRLRPMLADSFAEENFLYITGANKKKRGTSARCRCSGRLYKKRSKP